MEWIVVPLTTPLALARLLARLPSIMLPLVSCSPVAWLGWFVGWLQEEDWIFAVIVVVGDGGGLPARHLDAVNHSAFS